MPEYEPHFFCCHACQWILGESYREPDKRVTQLRVYRHARVFEEGMQILDVVLLYKYFTMMQVNDGAVMCEHCGAATSWYANQDAIAQMLQRQGARTKEVIET